MDEQGGSSIKPAEFRELIRFIGDLFPQAQAPMSKPPQPSFILRGKDDVPEDVSSRRLRLFQRCARVKEELRELVSDLKKEFKKPSAVLPKRCSSYKIAGEERVSKVSELNDRFAHITSKNPPKNASVLVPLEELRKLEAAFSHQQEILSFIGWLVSAQYKYVDDSGFVPVDKALYDRLCESLARALEDANRSSFAFSAYTNLLKKSHFLQFAAPSVTSGQKGRLLASDPFSEDLFDPETLKEVSTEFDNDVATTSHVQLSKAVSSSLYKASKRSRDDSPSSVVSKTPRTQSSSTSSSKTNSSSLFEPPPKGMKNWRGGRGRGRGAGRGKDNVAPKKSDKPHFTK